MVLCLPDLKTTEEAKSPRLVSCGCATTRTHGPWVFVPAACQFRVFTWRPQLRLPLLLLIRPRNYPKAKGNQATSTNATRGTKAKGGWECMNQETTATTHEHRQRGTLRITTHTTGLDRTSPHTFMPHKITFMPSRKMCREATNARQRV